MEPISVDNHTSVLGEFALSYMLLWCQILCYSVSRTNLNGSQRAFLWIIWCYSENSLHYSLQGIVFNDSLFWNCILAHFCTHRSNNKCHIIFRLIGTIESRNEYLNYFQWNWVRFFFFIVKINLHFHLINVNKVIRISWLKSRFFSFILICLFIILLACYESE